MRRLLSREPTLLIALLKAVLIAAVAFGLPITDGQTEALLGVATAVVALGVINRAVVTPVKSVTDLAGEIGGNATKLADRLTRKGE